MFNILLATQYLLSDCASVEIVKMAGELKMFSTQIYYSLPTQIAHTE